MAVDRYMQPYIEMRDFSGVVLISRRGHVIVDHAYGLADRERHVAVTPATTFGIGSVSKTFTAAAVLLLSQRAKLSLHDPIGRYLPGFAHGDSITIEHLLAHQSGLQDYYSYPEYASGRTAPISLTQFADLAQTKPLDFVPGSASKYSSTGYKVLALLIERVSGTTYEQFLQRNLFAPLHLEHTGDLHDGRPVDGLATGYDPGFPPERLQPAVRESLTWLEGNGSLYSTADDLLRWAEAARTDSVVQWSRFEYPFGWGKRHRVGRDMIEQTGRVPIGYVTYLGLYPADDVVIVVLSNIQAAITDRLSNDLATLAFGGASQVPAVRPQSVGESERAQPSFAHYAGAYEIAPGFVLTVKDTPRGLLLAGPDGAFLPMDWENGSRFFFRPLYVSVSFTANRTGQTDALVWDDKTVARKLP
jgi:CubicO group peptidase (beta-lactamase class C family)